MGQMVDLHRMAYECDWRLAVIWRGKAGLGFLLADYSADYSANLLTLCVRLCVPKEKGKGSG